MLLLGQLAHARCILLYDLCDHSRKESGGKNATCECHSGIIHRGGEDLSRELLRQIPVSAETGAPLRLDGGWGREPLPMGANGGSVGPRASPWTLNGISAQPKLSSIQPKPFFLGLPRSSMGAKKPSMAPKRFSMGSKAISMDPKPFWMGPKPLCVAA